MNCMCKLFTMYLHFEDWTDPRLLQSIEERGMTHGDRIIKVLASDVDPRVVLGRSALTIVESSGEVFASNEMYSYPRRRTLTGDELEDCLALYGLSQVAQRSIRSLFRFSNAQGFCQAAMAAQKSKQQWLIRHPLQDIDGIAMAKKLAIRARLIHLDIFFPNSLENLRHIVDYDDEAALIDKTDWMKWLSKDPTLRKTAN